MSPDRHYETTNTLKDVQSPLFVLHLLKEKSGLLLVFSLLIPLPLSQIKPNMHGIIVVLEIRTTVFSSTY